MFFILCIYITPFRVLIDTWWNVNVTIKPGEVRAFTVLIDTWWNVNDKDDHKAGAKYKF